MSGHSQAKYVGITIYKNVYQYKKTTNKSNEFIYKAKMFVDGKRINTSSLDLRTCALDLDKLLIKAGKDPINILKKKPKEDE